MALPPLSPAIVGMVPYSVPRHPAPLDLLLDGIGGLSSPPDLFNRLADADPELLVRGYPDARALAARLATDLGVAADRVLVTAGGTTPWIALAALFWRRDARWFCRFLRLR